MSVVLGNVPTALWLENFVVWRCGVDWPTIEKVKSEHYSYEHYYSVRLPSTLAQKGALCPFCLQRLAYPACVIFDRSFPKQHVADHVCFDSGLRRVLYDIDFDHLFQHKQELHETLVDVSPLPYELMDIIETYSMVDLFITGKAH